MKLLNGKELAEFVKERQAQQVRALRQADGVIPKLAIIRTNPNPVVDSYMNLKQNYGADINVDVDVLTIDQADAIAAIERLNKDSSVHGIIVQIPLPNPKQTTEVLNTIIASKDVDGLAEDSLFDAATPMSINWLLAGYNINLPGKKIVIVGHGRLVGRPLAKLWNSSSLDITVADKSVDSLTEITKQADIIVSATGVPGLIKANMIKPTAIVVDAGVATDKNGLVGDVATDVRELSDIVITPVKGGVGPLTICALFDNVIRAARSFATEK